VVAEPAQLTNRILHGSYAENQAFSSRNDENKAAALASVFRSHLLALPSHRWKDKNVEPGKSISPAQQFPEKRLATRLIEPGPVRI
jgi:hypothetical protein